MKRPIWTGKTVEVFSYLGNTRTFYLLRDLRTNKFNKSPDIHIEDILHLIDDETDLIRFTAWLKERGHA